MGVGEPLKLGCDSYCQGIKWGTDFAGGSEDRPEPFRGCKGDSVYLGLVLQTQHPCLLPSLFSGCLMSTWGAGSRDAAAPALLELCVPSGSFICSFIHASCPSPIPNSESRPLRDEARPWPKNSWRVTCVRVSGEAAAAGVEPQF